MVFEDVKHNERAMLLIIRVVLIDQFRNNVAAYVLDLCIANHFFHQLKSPQGASRMLVMAFRELHSISPARRADVRSNSEPHPLILSGLPHQLCRYMLRKTVS
jgi:hypothetical protein